MDMEKMTKEYLRSLKNERDRLNKLIDLIETEPTKAQDKKAETIVESAKIILRQEGHPMTTREIFSQLKARGLKSKASKPLESVAMMLYKANKRNDIKRVGRGIWDI